MVALTSIAADVEMIHTDQEAFTLDTMIEAHPNESEHVVELADLRWSPHREDSVRDAFPDSSLGEVASSSGAPEATEKASVCHEFTPLLACSYTPKASDPMATTSTMTKEAMVEELHAFFVTLFGKRSLHVPN
jgi:hypothetical protein